MAGNANCEFPCNACCTVSCARATSAIENSCPQAELAADIVGRIRTDEEIHVRSLRLYLGELRELTIKTENGGTLAGATVIDRFWQGLVDWATVEQPRLAAQAQHETITGHINEHPDCVALQREFDKLADPQLQQVSAG